MVFLNVIVFVVISVEYFLRLCLVVKFGVMLDFLNFFNMVMFVVNSVGCVLYVRVNFLVLFLKMSEFSFVLSVLFVLLKICFDVFLCLYRFFFILIYCDFCLGNKNVILFMMW